VGRFSVEHSFDGWRPQTTAPIGYSYSPAAQLLACKAIFRGILFLINNLLYRIFYNMIKNL
jgi:hypothetical protein